MNYYEILGVALYANPDDIKKAYYNLLKQYHPDVFKGDSILAQEMIRDINLAFETLSDPEKKVKYDYELRHIVKDDTLSGHGENRKQYKSEMDKNASNMKEPTLMNPIVNNKTRDKNANREKIMLHFPDIKGCLWSIIGYAAVALIIYKAFGGHIDTQAILQWGETFASKQIHQTSKILEKDKSIDNIKNFEEGTPSYTVAKFLNSMKERFENSDIEVTDYVTKDFGKEFEASFNTDSGILENNCIFNDEYLKYYRDDYWNKCSEFKAWIEDEETKGDSVKLKVEIDAADYARSVEKAYVGLEIENAKKMKKNLHGLPDSELPSIFVKKLKNAVFLYDKTYIVNLTFSLEKIDGHYIITGCNDTQGFVNALLANGLSPIDTGEFDYLLLKYIE